MEASWPSARVLCGSNPDSNYPRGVDTTRGLGLIRSVVTSLSTVYATVRNQIVWLRVQGKGTFQISAGLKEYTRRMIQRGHRTFVVDLGHCEIMDSTFMGTLAGLALRLREVGSGSLSVIDANARNSQLLENLGLDHLFGFSLPEGVTPLRSVATTDRPLAITPGRVPEEEHKKTMLDAHEALVEASPENEAKFRDVLDLLKQEPASDAHDG